MLLRRWRSIFLLRNICANTSIGTCRRSVASAQALVIATASQHNGLFSDPVLPGTLRWLSYGHLPGDTDDPDTQCRVFSLRVAWSCARSLGEIVVKRATSCGVGDD